MNRNLPGLVKIAIVSSRFPYPLEKGDKLRLYHQIESLAQDHEVSLFCLSDEEISADHLLKLKSMCKKVHVYFLPGWKSKLKIVSGIFSKLPLQVLYFLDRRIISSLGNDLEKYDPDLIFCQLIRMAEYVKGIRVRKCIDYMDAFSVVMSRRAQESSGFMKKISFIEAKRVKKYETDIYSEFDGHTIITPSDAFAFHESIKDKLKVIPNGVDVDFYHPNQKSRDYNLLFVGNMGYHPNVRAGIRLVDKIIPGLKSRDINLLIAGARPTAQVQNLASSRVRISGWMDDIREAYWNAQIFVAPIHSGAGQQNKILEAMACGIPCITTRLVNQGIGAKPGDEILICDTDKNFSETIEQVLADRDLRSNIALNARNFVEKEFSWKKSGEMLKQYIEEIYKLA